MHRFGIRNNFEGGDAPCARRHPERNESTRRNEEYVRRKKELRKELPYKVAKRVLSTTNEGKKLQKAIDYHVARYQKRGLKHDEIKTRLLKFLLREYSVADLENPNYIKYEEGSEDGQAFKQARRKGLSEDEAHWCTLLRNEIEYIVFSAEPEGSEEEEEVSEDSSTSLGERSDISRAVG